jgi:hypothetical protein
VTRHVPMRILDTLQLSTFRLMSLSALGLSYRSKWLRFPALTLWCLVAGLTLQAVASQTTDPSTALEPRLSGKVDALKAFPLAGDFTIEMSAGELRKKIADRIRAFATTSEVVKLAAQDVDYPRSELPIGFVVPVSVFGRTTMVLDDTGLVSDVDIERTGEYNERNDGSEIIRLVDHVSASGIQPFLGFKETWRLIYATMGDDRVHELTFATALPGSANYREVLSKLVALFGPLQPFEGAPEGFLEYPKERRLTGGRFFFKSTGEIGLEGAIFKTAETLLDAPVILELRVLRRLSDSPSYTRVTFAAERFSPMSKRYAERIVRHLQQQTHGLTLKAFDREWILDQRDIPFSFYRSAREGATQHIRARDPKSGELLDLTYSDVDLSSVVNIAIDESSGPRYARMWEIELGHPVELRIAFEKDGVRRSDLQETRAVNLLSVEPSTAMVVAVLAALPPVTDVTGEQVERIEKAFSVVGAEFNEPLFKFFKEADRQGKLKNRFVLAERAAGDERIALLRSFATEGDKRAVVMLWKALEERWKTSAGTPADRADMLHWAGKAAEREDAESLKFLLANAELRDPLAAERRMKALQALGEWDFADARTRLISQRAEMVRVIHSLPIVGKVRTYNPWLPKSLLGKQFSAANAQMEFSPKAKASDDPSSETVAFYEAGKSPSEGPAKVWVNVKGVVVGEHYILASDDAKGAVFDDLRAQLLQCFGEANLIASDNPGGSRRIQVVPNPAKTIYLSSESGVTALTVIEHGSK